MNYYQLLMPLVEEILPEIVNVRHTIHRNPELALQEYDTAALIRRTLDPTGLQLYEPFLKTDVVAMLEGMENGGNVTLRADMDALPLQEMNDLPYRSARDGVMHACGHDGHTAVLLGTALVLSRLKNTFKGSVRFVFQPGEEMVAAGRDLVAQGILRDPEPQAVFTLHALSDIPVGSIASRSGVIMAAADFFKIVIHGKGAHGSMPETSIDPVLTGARIVEALQAVASRNINPLDAVVVSVCRFSGGTNGNIIPDNVELEGTTRYLNEETGRWIPMHMERIIKGVCDSMGASYEFSYNTPYIPTINNPKMVAMGAEVTRELLGAGEWAEIEAPSLGGEDFSYYIKDYPGAMFRLGMGEEYPGLHNPYFDFNDKALRNGILFMSAIALKALSEGCFYSNGLNQQA
ncbi:MAG: M20 metallopeptidase family protein [bacterium]|jgi:amidohydrolase|nr:M20 family metallopeptidase [bacterium]